MPHISKLLATVAVALGALLSSTQSFAVYTVNIQQVGSDVVATGGGSINLTALHLAGLNGAAATLMWPSSGDLRLGTGNFNVYNNFVGPANFGTGGITFADSNTGVVVSVYNTTEIHVPTAYVSGANLGTSTATWNGATYTSLGITPGTYTWSWGAAGPNADSFIVNIVAPPPTTTTPVPTLSEYGLILLASLMAMFGIWQVRKRQR